MVVFSLGDEHRQVKEAATIGILEDLQNVVTDRTPDKGIGHGEMLEMLRRKVPAPRC